MDSGMVADGGARGEWHAEGLCECVGGGRVGGRGGGRRGGGAPLDGDNEIGDPTG